MEEVVDQPLVKDRAVRFLGCCCSREEVVQRGRVTIATQDLYLFPVDRGLAFMGRNRSVT